MSADYVNGLIGAPWARAGANCWDVTRRVQREMFGRDLPLVDGAPRTVAEIMAAIAAHPERARWRRVDQPAHGAIVLMGRCASGAGRASHIGTYLDFDGGGVLHADERHGVAFVPPAILIASGWRALEYYLPHSDLSAS